MVVVVVVVSGVWVREVLRVSDDSEDVTYGAIPVCPGSVASCAGSC